MCEIKNKCYLQILGMQFIIRNEKNWICVHLMSNYCNLREFNWNVRRRLNVQVINIDKNVHKYLFYK